MQLDLSFRCAQNVPINDNPMLQTTNRTKWLRTISRICCWGMFRSRNLTRRLRALGPLLDVFSSFCLIVAFNVPSGDGLWSPWMFVKASSPCCWSNWCNCAFWMNDTARDSFDGFLPLVCSIFVDLSFVAYTPLVWQEGSFLRKIKRRIRFCRLFL